MAECSFFQVSMASVVKASELIDICPVINELLEKSVLYKHLNMKES